MQEALSSEEIARGVISVLSVTYSIVPNYVVAAMRDRASTNTVALRTMKVIYPDLVDIGCYSHTIDLVGQHFNLPNLGVSIGMDKLVLPQSQNQAYVEGTNWKGN